MAIIVFLLTTGCKTRQVVNVDQSKQFFTVSLYSPGSGIDHEAKGIIINTINKYTEMGHTITYTKVGWGWEGEVDFCFTLEKLDPKIYKAFHDELIGLLKGRRVNILEQKPCRNPQ